MTPKEKANELWSKFFHKQIDVTGDGDGELAYQCALIAAEEVITELYDHGDSANRHSEWVEIKEEIEKL